MYKNVHIIFEAWETRKHLQFYTAQTCYMYKNIQLISDYWAISTYVKALKHAICTKTFM